MVKTKIIATLGPSSNSETILRKMFVNGIDGVRLNFSHGTHAEHICRIKLIRILNKKMRRAVKIMQDLEGYRIRIGKLPVPIEVKKNQEFYLVQGNFTAEEGEVPFDYEGPLKKVSTGEFIYVNDGKIILRVKKKEKGRIRVKAVTAGLLESNKGVNIPGVALEFPSVSRKDKEDVKVAFEYGLDYIAQSFVRNAKDLKCLKAFVSPNLPQCKIFAKVECQEALNNIDEIVEVADGIIIARGDLGICVPIYKVPVLQKEIIKKCLLKNKPVVVATQMLESMTSEVLPTRAEVSDVANAILDGATHLLLSGETAVGKHPYKVVDMMNKIIKNTESYKNKLKEIFI